MLTTFNSRCLLIIAVLISTIGIGVVYPLGTSRKSPIILNSSPAVTFDGNAKDKGSLITANATLFTFAIVASALCRPAATK